MPTETQTFHILRARHWQQVAQTRASHSRDPSIDPLGRRYYQVLAAIASRNARNAYDAYLSDLPRIPTSNT